MKVIIDFIDGTQKIENCNDFITAMKINAEWTKKAHKKGNNILSIQYGN